MKRKKILRHYETINIKTLFSHDPTEIINYSLTNTKTRHLKKANAQNEKALISTDAKIGAEPKRRLNWNRRRRRRQRSAGMQQSLHQQCKNVQSQNEPWGACSSLMIPERRAHECNTNQRLICTRTQEVGKFALKLADDSMVVAIECSADESDLSLLLIKILITHTLAPAVTLAERGVASGRLWVVGVFALICWCRLFGWMRFRGFDAIVEVFVRFSWDSFVFR